MIQILAATILIILSADFLSGFIHWWEDAYGNPNWKILGKHIIEPNLNHHTNPRDFIK